MDFSKVSSEGKNKKKRVKRNGDKGTFPSEVQITDRGKEDSGLTEDTSKRAPKKNIPEIDMFVRPLTENLEILVDSREKNSESNAAKRKKKKKMKEEKTIIPDEVHIMDGGKDDSGWEENLFETDLEKNLLADLPVQSQAEKVENFLDFKEEIFQNNTVKKKMSKNKKKKTVIQDEARSEDWGREDLVCTEIAVETDMEHNLIETDLSVQPQAENLSTAANSREKNSEGNAEKKKKKMASIPDEVHIHIIDWGGEDSGWVENHSETTLKQNLRDTELPVQLQSVKLEADADSKEHISKDNIVEKIRTKKKKKKKKQKVAPQDEIHIMDWEKHNSLLAENAFEIDLKQNLVEVDLSVQQRTEKLEILADSKEQHFEGNAEKKKKKKVAIVPDDVHIIDRGKEDSVWMQNLSEADLKQNLCDTNLYVQFQSEKLEINADSKVQISEENKMKKKKKKKKKETTQDEVYILDWGKENSVQSENTFETDLKQNRPETDLSLKLLAEKLEFVAGPKKNYSEGIAEIKEKRKTSIPDDVHIMDVEKTDSGWTESLLKQNVRDICSPLQLQSEKLEIVPDLKEQFFKENVAKKKKIKKNKDDNKNKAASRGRGKENSVWTENDFETDLKHNLLETDSPVQTAEKLEIISDSKEQISEGNTEQKQKRKMKKNASIPVEAHLRDGEKEVPGWEEDILEKGLKLNHLLETDLSVDENLSIIPNSEENFAEVNADKKKKRRLRKKKAKFQDEVQVAEITTVSTQKNFETELKENLTEIDLTMHPHAENPEVTVDLLENITEANPTRKKRRCKKRKRSTKNARMKDEVLVVSENVPCLDLIAEPSGRHENGLCAVNKEVILDSENVSGYVKATEYLSVGRKNNEMCSSPGIPLAVPIRKKLLVLDVNGLLADIVMPAPKHCRGDIHIYGRAIFRRPFCHDFLRFCFQNFDIGIWSSRSKKVIDRVVDYLLGNLKDKLLFCWDIQQTTPTGFKTLENKHKPLVCKELRRIWENDNPSLPWKNGDYDESNTLLLDDSPYKALLNPLHTSIFPHSYGYMDKSDNSLGPGGDLRVYLEGLLKTENVQKYVEQHPFGQRAIDDKGTSGQFYAEVLRKISQPLDHNICHLAGILNNSLPMEACC